MKKIVTFLILSTCLLQLQAQVCPVGPAQLLNAFYEYKWTKFRESIQIPRHAAPSTCRDTAGMYYNPADSNLYWYTGNQYRTFTTNLDSLRAIMRNAFQNDTDVVLMGGTVRMTSNSPITWQFVSQITPDHYTLGFDSLTITNAGAGFTIHYPHQHRPITFVAVPDESYINQGWQMGATVGLDSATVLLTRFVYVGEQLWFNNLAPGRIDQYFANGLSTTYDTTTGEFVSQVPNAAFIPRYLSSKPASCLTITQASTTTYPVIDANATFNDPTINTVHWYIYNRATNVKITGTQSLQPIAFLSGPGYWTSDPTNFPVDAPGNIWLFAMFRKYQ